MQNRILLVDESLTVQKVVALTLDKDRFDVTYARQRPEVIRAVVERAPELILVSDQMPDVQWQSFPKEVEAWLGRDYDLPIFVLITSQNLTDAKHYSAVLKKPFTPQLLQSIVDGYIPTQELAGASDRTDSEANEGFEDQRLEKMFNESFSNESKLVQETFRAEVEQEEPTQLDIPAPRGMNPPRPHLERRGMARAESESRMSASNSVPPAMPGSHSVWEEAPKKAAPRPKTFAPPESAAVPPAASFSHSALGEADNARRKNPPPAAPSGSLWGESQKVSESPAVLSASESMAYKAVLESEVQKYFSSHPLEETLQKILETMLPPVIERLVEQRLDLLMKEQENADSSLTS